MTVPHAAALAALAAMSIQSSDVAVDGLRLHVEDAGPRAAPTVVLLHGWLVSTTTYAELQRALAQRYRVLALDQPGHGRSARVERRLEVRYLASAVAAALRALDVADAVLVGNSMGGLVALGVARWYPERVARVIATNPVGFRIDPLRRAGMALLFNPRVYATGPSFAYRVAAAGSTAHFGAQGQADLDEQLALRRDPSWCRAAASAYRTIAAGVLQDEASRIRVPTTLVFGALDLAMPAAYQAEARAAMPQAEVVVIPDCGHNVHHDAPGRLIDIIDRAVTRVAGPREEP